MSKPDKIPTAALYELRDCSYLGVSFPDWDYDEARYVVGGAAMLMVSQLALLAYDRNVPNRKMRVLVGLARALASIVPDGEATELFADLIGELRKRRGATVDPDYTGPYDMEGE